MKLQLNDISIADIIALIVVVGGLFLKYKGMDGNISLLLILVVSFYFGNKLAR